ncbi:MAG: hypothetical protein NTX15_02400 [Candidatus Kapabacteria bacterium]|nr:hypothetical protein [Candidatus Kapabacteria bacterium]
MRRILVLLLAIATPIVASAQLGNLLVPFAPKDCINDAKTAVGGTANNPRLVALFNAGLSVPLGTDTVNIGMSTKDGKARLWYYVFIASAKDTIAAAPMMRVVFACQDPTSLAGGAAPSVPLDGLSTTPLPAGYKEGSALASALASNTEYMRFTKAHPDSQPGVSVLSTSTEDAFSFPAGTPFWAISWTDINGTGTDPFICLVHSITGQSLCGDQLTLSVSEIKDVAVYLAPNPVRDNAILNLPISWIGKSVVIEAVSTSGAIIEITSINALASPIATINGSMLSSGAYTLRARTATDYIVLPMSVIR